MEYLKGCDSYCRQIIDKIKFDEDVLNSIKLDAENNVFDKIYILSSKFIYEKYIKLCGIVMNANCSSIEKTKIINYLSSESKNYREQKDKKIAKVLQEENEV